MFSVPYKEYGIAHNNFNFVFKQSASNFDTIIPFGEPNRGNVSFDPSASAIRDHFCTISDKFVINKAGYYSISMSFLMYLKFSVPNLTSFGTALFINTNPIGRIAFDYPDGSFANVVNEFLFTDYSYVSSPLSTQVMTRLFSTTPPTFECRGLFSYYSIKLRLQPGDEISFRRFLASFGTVNFDWIMNGNIWVEKLS